MQLRSISLATLAAQLVLGNFCMMPMAMAQDDMGMGSHEDMGEMEQVMEMVMTPVNAMSPAHCEGCVTITRPKHHTAPMQGGRMPCTDGHCLTQHSPSTAVVTQSSQKDILRTIARPAFVAIEFPEIVNVGFRPRAGPHIQGHATRTVVLRE